MSDITIESATDIYGCKAEAKIEHRRVSHPPFRDYSVRLRHFISTLGETAEDDYWKPLIRFLKRYRYEASVAPLGFGNPYFMSPEDVSKFESSLSICPLLFPEFDQQIMRLKESLKSLISDDENPLLQELTELVATGWPLTVALKETRHIPVFEEMLTGQGLNPLITVVSEAQLRGARSHERIACIGAGCWYEDYVFRAPRARHILVLRFDWIRDQASWGHVFEGWEHVRSALNIARPTNEQTSTNVVGALSVDDGMIDGEDLFPRVDLANISRGHYAAG